MHYQSRNRRRSKRKFYKQASSQIDFTTIQFFNTNEISQISTDSAVMDEEPEDKKVVEDGSKIREFLRKHLLDSYRDEYKEYADTIRGLETKAQGTIAIAGIFIAGAFVFLRESSPQLLTVEKVLLGTSISFFVITVFHSVSVLTVGEACLPPAGSSIEKIYIHCLNIDQETKLFNDISGFMNEQSNAWRKVKFENIQIIVSKAELLQAAQDFIKMAIVLIASLIIFRIYQHL